VTADRAATLHRRWGWATLALFVLAVALDTSAISDYFAISALGGAAWCYAQRAQWAGWLARDDAQRAVDAIDRAEKAWRSGR
jgi:hypothetical protein